MKVTCASLFLLVLTAFAPAWNAAGAAAVPVPAPAAAEPAKPAVKLTDLFPDNPVAKGKGFEIKRSQLDDAVTSIAIRT